MASATPVNRSAEGAISIALHRYLFPEGMFTMPKTFVPQLIRILERLCNYIQKHHAVLASTLTPAQVAALDLIVSTCNANFGDYSVTPDP
jgi:hypothetical protein